MTAIDEFNVTRPRTGSEPGRRGDSVRRRASAGSLRLLMRLALFGAAVAGLVIAWIIGSHHFAPYILPGPGPVWDAFLSDWNAGFWLSDVRATLSHLFIAYGL